MRISDWSSDVCSSDLKQTAPLVKNPTSAEKDNVLKLINQKRYQEAEPLARHLTIKYPHDVFGWRALGWALRELGREDEALTPWFEALACSPQTASVHYGLGATLARKSQEVEIGRASGRERVSQYG